MRVPYAPKVMILIDGATNQALYGTPDVPQRVLQCTFHNYNNSN